MIDESARREQLDYEEELVNDVDAEDESMASSSGNDTSSADEEHRTHIRIHFRIHNNPLYHFTHQ